MILTRIKDASPSAPHATWGAITSAKCLVLQILVRSLISVEGKTGLVPYQKYQTALVKRHS